MREKQKGEKREKKILLKMRGCFSHEHIEYYILIYNTKDLTYIFDIIYEWNNV